MLCQEPFWWSIWTIIIARQLGSTPLYTANLSLCEAELLLGNEFGVTSGIFIIHFHFNVTWFAVFLNWLCQSTYTLCFFVCCVLSALSITIFSAFLWFSFLSVFFSEFSLYLTFFVHLFFGRRWMLESISFWKMKCYIKSDLGRSALISFISNLQYNWAVAPIFRVNCIFNPSIILK